MTRRLNAVNLGEHTRGLVDDYGRQTNAKTVTDDSGSQWAITGFWCDVCHLPMHESNAPYGTHPTCEIGATA